MKSTVVEEETAVVATLVPGGARTRVTSDPLLSSEPMQASSMSGRFLEMLLDTTTPPSPPWSDKGRSELKRPNEF